jgi:hypothetical protein
MLGTPVQSMLPDYGPMAEAGAFYVANGVAPGATAIDYAVSASFSATAAFCVAQNNDATAAAPFAPGRNLQLKFLRFTVSQAPASGTSAILACVTDVNRAPTAGSAAATIANCLQGAAANGSPAVVSVPSAALITVPAATSAAQTPISNLTVRSQIPVIGDQYSINFGASVPVSVLTSASASILSFTTVPIVLPPQGFAVFYLWFPSNAATEAKFSDLSVGFTMS